MAYFARNETGTINHLTGQFNHIKGFIRTATIALIDPGTALQCCSSAKPRPILIFTGNYTKVDAG